MGEVFLPPADLWKKQKTEKFRNQFHNWLWENTSVETEYSFRNSALFARLVDMFLLDVLTFYFLQGMRIPEEVQTLSTQAKVKFPSLNIPSMDEVKDAVKFLEDISTLYLDVRTIHCFI